MVQGAIKWGWKLRLIFFKKGELHSIDFYDYVDQVLIYLKHALAEYKEEVILIEDSAPIYNSYANGIRKLISIPIFFIKQPALLLDLNAIKKVQHQIKDKIS